MYNIHIPESYKVSKRDFECRLAALTDADALEVKAHRSMRSMCREWACHNFLYNLGILRDHTESVDINWPQKWYVRAAYFLLGWCKIFIK